jgi:type 2 lantibiotic biosynthesis protein LanM
VTASADRLILDLWCQAVSQGDWQAFQRRLAWDDLDPNATLQSASLTRAEDPDQSESWVCPWQALMEEAFSRGHDPGQPFLDPDDPVPFEAILAPLAAAGEARLRGHPAFRPIRLGEASLATLGRSLLLRLHALCSPALYEAFRNGTASSPAEGAGRYAAFMHSMLEKQGFRAFFAGYPVLARQATILVGNWVEASAEFTCHLDAAWPELCGTFGMNARSSCVAGITTDLGDLHHGGRCPIAIRFEHGPSLVYKPRSLGIDRAWFRLLAWLNRNGIPLPFQTLRVLDGGSHGWMEAVQAAPCDAQDLPRFYQRWGCLLSLVRCLGGTDCHVHNAIACGEQPVLVDLEAIMGPSMASYLQGGPTAGRRDAAISDSVLAAGILPRWLEGMGTLRDISALGSGEDRAVLAPAWTSINTDAMAYAPTLVRVPAGNGTPHRQGVPLSAEPHLGSVLTGFRTMQAFLRDHREALLMPGGPLEAFRNLRVRIGFRNTRLYAGILGKSLEPKATRDIRLHDIQLELLCRAFQREPARPGLWPIVAVERKALDRGDIPLFSVATTGRDLLDGQGTPILERLFAASPLEQCRSRLERLDEGDTERQVGLIKASWFCRFGDPYALEPAGGNAPVPPDRALSPDQWIEEALRLGRQLQAARYTLPPDPPAWVTLQPLWHTHRGRRVTQVDLAGPDLFHGLGGITLFFAALGRVTGETAHRDQALALLRPIIARLDQDPGLLDAQLSRHGMTGMGGLVYVLAQSGKLLGEEALCVAAHRAAGRILPDSARVRPPLGMVDGLAGTLHGLLTLWDATAHPAPLERAARVGHQLLARRGPAERGWRIWPPDPHQALGAGFSHGVSGIAWALARLHGATGETDFQAAAEEAVRWEQELHREDPGWSRERNAWSHGAAGVALGRVSGLRWMDSPEIQREIADAMLTTLGAQPGPIDDLCSGGLGRADILLEAGLTLDRPDWIQAARERGTAVVEAARRQGHYHLLWPASGLPIPGFIHGLAGLGYAALRLSRPGLLPCFAAMAGAPAGPAATAQQAPE